MIAVALAGTPRWAWSALIVLSDGHEHWQPALRDRVLGDGLFDALRKPLAGEFSLQMRWLREVGAVTARSPTIRDADWIVGPARGLTVSATTRWILRITERGRGLLAGGQRAGLLERSVAR